MIFVIIFNYLGQKLKFRFITKICYYCKDVIYSFPFDSGGLLIGTRTKSTHWWQKDLQDLGTATCSLTSPQARAPGTQSQNLGHLRDTAGFLSGRHSVSPSLSIPCSTQALLQYSCIPQSRAGSVFHLGSYAHLCLSRYHGCWNTFLKLLQARQYVLFGFASPVPRIVLDHFKHLFQWP